MSICAFFVLLFGSTKILNNYVDDTRTYSLIKSQLKSVDLTLQKRFFIVTSKEIKEWLEKV
ncbi:MAG TPA: hypothetical protein K8V51_02785 [Campylobacter avium]|uniref:hypothetical protein n=1 Tax=Campylobacter avium TaxID=522485 RepID=UPI001D76402B|nr:hypothetical protein [Campylobacter avium]HJE65970.1 hypothetical protein [Campylobacter avium]